MSIKNLLLVIFLAIQSVFPLFPAAQEINSYATGTDNVFSVEQLKADFIVLRKSLEEGHAGLYRYTPKSELDKMFNEIEASLVKPMTEEEYLLKLKSLISNIHCGHTSIGFSAAASDKFYLKPVVIPFSFKFIDGRTYLLNNLSDLENLKMGGEIIAINGKPVEEMIKSMLTLLPSDAHIQTSKYLRLERPDIFSMLYALLYGESTSFKIQYKSPADGNEAEVEVKGITRQTMREISEKRYPELNRNLPPVSFEYKGEIPVLTIRTFGSSPVSGEKDNAYLEYMRKIFVELRDKGSKNLIIDLRNNGGGNDDYGKIIASFLLDKPFDYYKALEVKKDTYDFFEYTNIPLAGRKIPEKSIKKNARGWYDYLDHPNVGRQINQEPAFKGKVYILINGGSFSTTGECTSIIHYHKKAMFVGEECGAGYYGNNSGWMPIVVLPNSKFRVSIPLIIYTMAVEGYPEDRGIIPDYPVSLKIEDLLKGKDTQMEYTLNLIGNKK